MILALAAALAIVVQDHTRCARAPRSGATELTTLWQGDVLEVRGERAGYLQVYNYRRERGGYFRSEAVRPVGLSAARCARAARGAALPARQPGLRGARDQLRRRLSQGSARKRATAEPFEAIARMAERLADEASGERSLIAEVGAHLEVVGQFGIHMRSFERNGRMQVCYDGELFHRVLGLAAASAEERALAALGLTRPDCIDPALDPLRAHPSIRSAAPCSTGSPSRT